MLGNTLARLPSAQTASTVALCSLDPEMSWFQVSCGVLIFVIVVVDLAVTKFPPMSIYAPLQGV